MLAVQGLTGIAFVELKGGSKSSPLLEEKEGDFYPVIRSGPSFFARLDITGTELVANMSKLERLVDTLQRLGQKLEQDPRVLLYGRELEMPGPGE